jgi:hypothetical protein
MSRTLQTLLLFALAALNGVASARGLSLADYKAVAGDAKNQVIFSHLRGWRSIDEEHLVLEASGNRFYLVTLFGRCMDLDFEHTIGVKNQGNVLSAGFDSIVVRNSFTHSLPCRIKTLQPIDRKALRAAEKAARAKKRV